MLISKLNKLDARRQQSRRDLDGGTAAPLGRINYGIEARNCKDLAPSSNGIRILE
jgi:hypothetical protein